MAASNDPMETALSEAKAAGLAGEVPVGAVLYDPASRQIVASAGNAVRARNDPTAHAEVLVIRAAANQRGDRLDNLDLYVTLEPCAMCAGAIALARLRRLYFGAYDTKGGGVEHGAKVFDQPSCSHAPEIYGGIRESECAALLKAFFAARR